MQISDRDQAVYLARLEGQEVASIAKEHGISRQRVHRILARIRDSGDVQVKVGASSLGAAGPIPATAIGDALRKYAQSLGVHPPD